MRRKAPGPFQAVDRDLKFARTEAEARYFGLEVEDVDKTHRPWGGFIKFRHSSLETFRRVYWTYGLTKQWKKRLDEVWGRVEARRRGLGLDAKLLLVAPGQRLSLQYHTRRAEYWRVIEGPVLVTVGTNEGNLSDLALRVGDVIRIGEGTWHRAEAHAQGWAVIAEFWEHTRPSPRKGADPEADVVRVDDDYVRVKVRVTLRTGRGTIGQVFAPWDLMSRHRTV